MRADSASDSASEKASRGTIAQLVCKELLAIVEGKRFPGSMDYEFDWFCILRSFVDRFEDDLIPWLPVPTGTTAATDSKASEQYGKITTRCSSIVLMDLLLPLIT